MGHWFTTIATALAHTMVAQVDPNQGTAQAKKGAAERLAEPNFYDVASPIIAFVLVIIVPSVVALWVIYKTVTEKDPGLEESSGASDN
jgi:hypothetical protein